MCCSPWGCEESRHDLATEHQQQQQNYTLIFKKASKNSCELSCVPRGADVHMHTQVCSQSCGSLIPCSSYFPVEGSPVVPLDWSAIGFGAGFVCCWECSVFCRAFRNFGTNLLNARSTYIHFLKSLVIYLYPCCNPHAGHVFLNSLSKRSSS